MGVINYPAIGTPLINSTANAILFAGTNGVFSQDASNFTYSSTNQSVSITSGSTSVPNFNITNSANVTSGNIFNITANVMTTGNAFGVTASALTTGSALILTVDGLTTGSGINITSASTVGNASKLINLTRSGTNSTASKTNYGVYSAITNTGTTSVNTAGYFSASGATTNYGVYVAAGDINIQTLTASLPVFTDASKNLTSTGTVPVANGGTGQTTYTNGQLLIGNTTGNTLAKATLTGTTDQVVVTNGGGTITLSTPQNIGTTSNPTFASLTVTGGTPSAVSGVLRLPNNNYITARNNANTGDALVFGLGSANEAVFGQESGNVASLLFRCDGAQTWRTAGSDRMILSSAGAVRMHAYGAGSATFDASGNITSVSDERMKDIQGEFDAGLGEILNINPILYKYNKQSGLDMTNVYAGFSAQNVMKYIPEAVGKNKEGFYSFNDRPVIAALVNAIKELKNELDEVREMNGLATGARGFIVPLENDERILVTATEEEVIENAI